MQLIPVIATVASAGISAYSSYQSGQAQKKAASYNAAVSRNNAILIQQQSRQEALLAQNQAQWQEYQQRVLENQAIAKRQEAEGLRTTSEENLRRRRDDYRRLLSRQRAQLGKAGLAMTGSPIEVLAESSARMELEAQDVVNQTRNAIEAMYYEAELLQSGAAAQGADVYLTQWRGRNALTGGKYRADMERTQGKLNLMGAQSAASASYMQAGSSLLSGIGTAGFGYYNMRTN